MCGQGQVSVIVFETWNDVILFAAGSEQRELFQTRRSCPAPKHLTSLDADKHNRLIPVSSLHGNGDDRISFGTKDPAGKKESFQPDVSQMCFTHV